VSAGRHKKKEKKVTGGRALRSDPVQFKGLLEVTSEGGKKNCRRRRERRLGAAIRKSTKKLFDRKYAETLLKKRVGLKEGGSKDFLELANVRAENREAPHEMTERVAASNIGAKKAGIY